ncbi:hypothetical protein ACN4EG_17040 [Alkalinema pantanalense CENA528]|uniref:hypothetical protein n=1 Tax=Alkalinema pantanalense TaxID=1620705 RepID=UPI003D6E90CD
MLPLDEPTAYGELAINLPLNIIATVLDITMVGWSYVISSGKVNISSTEPEIAGHLGREMTAEKNRRLGLKNQIRIEEEVGTRSSPTSDKPEGRIDIKIIYSFNEAEYFGIECKRVSSRDNSLAKKYVDEGIMRFVTGKYSPGHDWAAMVGFVIDGNSSDCINLIRNYLTQKCQETCMEKDWALDTNFGTTQDIYRTSHRQQGRSFLFKLLHLFLVIG